VPWEELNLFDFAAVPLKPHSGATGQEPKRAAADSTCACCRLSSQLFTRLQPFNLFVGEGRASKLHSTDFSRRNKLRDICHSEVPLLNRWEELFESAGAAWRHDHCEVNGPIIDGLPRMGDARRKGDDVSRIQDPTTVRTPNRNCALKDLKDFVLNIVQVAGRPETGRRTVIEDAEVVVGVKAECPDASHFSPGGSGELAQTLSPAYDGGFRCIRHAADFNHRNLVWERFICGGVSPLRGLGAYESRRAPYRRVLNRDIPDLPVAR
jgi:hypothetical protein